MSFETRIELAAPPSPIRIQPSTEAENAAYWYARSATVSIGSTQLSAPIASPSFMPSVVIGR